MPSRRFSVAPMMDWTNRHCRFFHRLLSCNALLYSEMVTTGALLHGDIERHLAYSQCEHPLALQLGGSDPGALAHCAVLAEEWGYDEVNLNCGCPSDRVQSGRFGACLMAEPALVRDCVKAMLDTTSLPVTVKCRIGIDNQNSQSALDDFIGQVSEAGCNRFIIHARKAWLDGLSPKENRDIPPLDYPRVRQLKANFPSLEIILNGGIQSIEQAKGALEWADGVMMGRSAYQDPWLLTHVDQDLFNRKTQRDMQSVIESLVLYAENLRHKGLPIKLLTRHILGLFNGQKGARRWRRYLSEHAQNKEAEPKIIHLAAASVLPDISFV